MTKPVNLPVLLARVQGQLARRREAGPFKVEIGGMVGPYRVDSLLGQGGMATVYEASDTRLGRPVALKILSAEMSATPLQVERFLREARALARVRHPGVVAIYEVASSPCYYLAMELVRGRTLDHFLEGRALPPRQAAALARQVALALQEVHRHGILHRDLKPSNLILDGAGEVHLMDFGLARIVDADTSLTRSGTLLGTPQYMAPEQVDERLGPVGPKTDLHALGLILYELLTGCPPLKGRTVSTLLYEILQRTPEAPSLKNPEVPPALDALCLRLQARKPEDRCADAAEVVRELDRFLRSA